jgi:hypothetical protein
MKATFVCGLSQQPMRRICEVGTLHSDKRAQEVNEVDL